jgi:putative oxidoreductase
MPDQRFLSKFDNEKTADIFKSMTHLLFTVFNLLERMVAPVLLLIIRLWMANIFWNAGVVKISDWQTTLALFQQEYKVPFIQPDIAAYLTAAVELSCPVLLVLGVATRLATLPMIVMILVIQFTYLNSNEHLYWLMLLGTLLCFGPGRLSLDYLLRRRHEAI